MDEALGGIITRLPVYGVPALMILTPRISFLAYSFLQQDNGTLTVSVTLPATPTGSYLCMFSGRLPRRRALRSVWR